MCIICVSKWSILILRLNFPRKKIFGYFLEYFVFIYKFWGFWYFWEFDILKFWNFRDFEILKILKILNILKILKIWRVLRILRLKRRKKVLKFLRFFFKNIVSFYILRLFLTILNYFQIFECFWDPESVFSLKKIWENEKKRF